MPRQELFVDPLKLKQVIDQLEDEQIAKGAPPHRPFRSRSELQKAVALTDWGQAIGLSPVVVAIRIERYSIECKTGVRGRGPAGAPGAPGAPLDASGAEPDEMSPPIIPVRRSVFRGIDLDAFLAPFLERGLEIDSLSSIMTSSIHTRPVNLKIQAAWHDLRERFSIPRVGDKPLEIESILPLDQIRLPGSEVSEPISDLETAAVSTEFDSEVVEEYDPTYDEMTAREISGYDEAIVGKYGPDTESVGAVGTGWSEGDYDESQPADSNPWPVEEDLDEVQDSVVLEDTIDQVQDSEAVEVTLDQVQTCLDGFYDLATDEAVIEQVRTSLDAIEQEGGFYTQAPESEPFTKESLDQVAAAMGKVSWDDEYGSGAGFDQEPYLGELPPEVVQDNVAEDDWTREFEFNPEAAPASEPVQDGESTEYQGEVQGEYQDGFEFDNEAQAIEEPPTGLFPEPGFYQNAWPGEQSPEGSVSEFPEESLEMEEIVEEDLLEVMPDQGSEPVDGADPEWDEFQETGELPLDEYPEVNPEQADSQDVDLDLDEFLAAGGVPSGEYQEDTVAVASAPQDEYLPFDFEDGSVPVEDGADNYDSSMYETEETDPNETR